MIRAIVLASLAVGASAQTALGMATCQCLGEALWTTFAGPQFQIDCSWEWANDEGKCQSPPGLASNFTDYPGDYGETCKAWLETGHSSCTDLTTVPPTQKPLSEQADWCSAPWCYIDPCNCDAPDATKSDYFPGEVFYSYATCGEKNTFVGVASATNTVGNAECTSAASEEASDAHSLQMGCGLS